jgi:GNAT superfamily N-acetyltransferase
VNPFAILQFNEENEMKSKTIRPGEPERDFAQMAAWFSIMEDEPTTETKLKEYFEKEKKRIIQQVIEDEQGELAGFYWMVHDRLVQRRASFDLFVRPEKRGCGTGSLLYEGVLQAAKNTGVKNIRVNISDIDKESLTFAGKRGFKEQRHEFLMCLDLKAFDDQPYNETLARLKEQGFIFFLDGSAGRQRGEPAQAVCPERHSCSQHTGDEWRTPLGVNRRLPEKGMPG